MTAQRVLPWLCGVLLASSVIFGGGTHPGFLGDVIVQLLAVPLLVAASWSALKPGRLERETKQELLLFGIAVFLLIFIQLLPLPLGEWTFSRVLADGNSPTALPSKIWSPVSVSPQATWAAVVSLFVPCGIFLAVIQCNIQQTLTLTWLLLVLGTVALLLAFLQMLGGPESELRFYSFTNATEAVGFFANRNHFAAQLNVTLVLSSIWRAIVASQLPRSHALQTPRVLVLTAAAVLLVSIAAGLAMARSRAGIFLGLPALAGALFLTRHSGRKGSRHEKWMHRGYIGIASAVFATLFAAQFGFGSIASRFGGDPLDDLRIPLTSVTFELAFKSLPFGTGLGTFVPVYATAEKGTDLSEIYANRAHNDLAEFFLETGLPGALLLIAFLIWFGRKSYGVWFRRQKEENDQGVLLQRAATLIIALLLAHSLVDYPLRTTAHGAIFAFFCAICATKARSETDFLRTRKRVFAHIQSPSENLPVEKWGSDMNWPKSWRR
jgi:O-antigen ligase